MDGYRPSFRPAPFPALDMLSNRLQLGDGNGGVDGVGDGGDGEVGEGGIKLQRKFKF